MPAPPSSSDASASPQMALQRLDDALLNLRRDAALYARSTRVRRSHPALVVSTPSSSSKHRSCSDEFLPLYPSSQRLQPVRSSSSAVPVGRAHSLPTKVTVRRLRPSHSMTLSQRASVDLPPPREEAEEEHDPSIDTLLHSLATARQTRLEDQCAAPPMLRSSFASTQSSFGSIPPTPGADAPSLMGASPALSTQSLPPSPASAPGPGATPVPSPLPLPSSHPSTHSHSHPHPQPQPHPPSSFPRRALNLTLPIRHSKRISKLWNGSFPGTIAEPPSVGLCKTD